MPEENGTGAGYELNLGNFNNEISNTAPQRHSVFLKKEDLFSSKIIWHAVMVHIFIHVGLVYGLILMITSAKLYTILFAFILIYTSGFGITAGAHRLWSHRAYKAKWPLRLLLMVLFTISGQRDVYTWTLEHRVHHKYCETDSDPHNAKRGLFFAHIGWLIVTPHPDVVAKRKVMDMRDLEADPIVMWQKKLYPLLFIFLTIGLPVFTPTHFWEESLWNSFWLCFCTRFVITLHIAFSVNSVAHMWGQKPYDKYINSSDNLAVSVASLGEGWHNYHHVFPWDYKAGELGGNTNISAVLIKWFSKIGWAYDLKEASHHMIARRISKTGDGSHVWGYGDTDIPQEDLEELERMKD